MAKDEAPHADLAEQIARLRAEMDAMMAETVNPAMRDAARRAETITREQADALAGKVREQPLLAVLLAAGVGFLLGRVTR